LPLLQKIALHRGFFAGHVGEVPIVDTRAQGSELLSGYHLALRRDISFFNKGLLHACSFRSAEKGHPCIVVSDMAFERLPLAPDYRNDLDLTALDARGNRATMVSQWYDGKNGGRFPEHVGSFCVHQKFGPASALIGHGMKRIARIAPEEGGRFDGLCAVTDKAFYHVLGFM
jgi:hypothetical protein